MTPEEAIKDLQSVWLAQPQREAREVLFAHIDTLTAELSTHRKAYAELQQKTRTLEADNLSLESDNDKLTTDLAEQTAENNRKAERIQTLEAEAKEQADFLDETVTHTQEVEKELVGLKKRYKLTIDYHNKKDIGRDTQLSGLLESNLKLEQKVQTLEAELKEALEYMSTWHSKSLADTQKLTRATDALKTALAEIRFGNPIDAEVVIRNALDALADITEGQDDAITC